MLEIYSRSKTTHFLKCTMFVHVDFSSLQEYTNNVYLRRWAVLEPYAISTSKIYSYFHKAPKNMKQLASYANSTCLLRKIY